MARGTGKGQSHAVGQGQGGGCGPPGGDWAGGPRLATWRSHAALAPRPLSPRRLPLAAAGQSSPEGSVPPLPAREDAAARQRRAEAWHWLFPRRRQPRSEARSCLTTPSLARARSEAGREALRPGNHLPRRSPQPLLCPKALPGDRRGPMRRARDTSACASQKAQVAPGGRVLFGPYGAFQKLEAML